MNTAIVLQRAAQFGLLRHPRGEKTPFTALTYKRTYLNSLGTNFPSTFLGKPFTLQYSSCSNSSSDICMGGGLSQVTYVDSALKFRSPRLVRLLALAFWIDKSCFRASAWSSFSKSLSWKKNRFFDKKEKKIQRLKWRKHQKATNDRFLFEDWLNMFTKTVFYYFYYLNVIRNVVITFIITVQLLRVES